MKMNFLKLANLILSITLLASLFLIGLTSSVAVYDPWADINNDGTIDIFDAIMLANAFGGNGTPQTKAIMEFDSGWIDITDKAGQDIIVAHGLGSMDVMVDITGRATVDGGVHQKQLGGEDYYAETWNQTYGGTELDEAWSLVQTVDGGYALAGYTYSFGAGSYDFWLVKTDASGNSEWNQTYGGTSSDQAYSLVQTVDGGYALLGWTWSYGAGSSDFWLVKTDADGNALWNRTYGGTYAEYAYPLIQTVDGGYALAGYTTSYGAGQNDFWLVKTDAGGNALWSQTYGGTSNDQAYSLVQTVDGGYALAGGTYSFGAGSYDFWLVKTDSNGDMPTGLFKYGLAWIDSTLDSITLHRGTHDPYWNFVRVRIWKIQ